MLDRIFTIGHSTHPIDEFMRLLSAYGVRTLVDVRTVPRSRHNPQFAEDALSASLADRGLAYRRLEALGGLRHSRKDSINTGWRNASFRGYADYMQTPSFLAGLDDLIVIARSTPTAIMCAEAVPWRCHRSMIGDALVVRGWQVDDIMTEASVRPHLLTRFARVDGTSITYPAAD